MVRVADQRRRIMEQISAERRKLGASSPSRFARIYLPHHFNKPMSRMHKDLFKMLKHASAERPQRLAVAAPRGHAKTTVVSLAYALWCAIYQKEMFILIISATKDQASGILKTIKDQLQGNNLLLQDFPEVCYPPGLRPAPKPWRDNQIVLRNGVCIKALGAGQSIRGMKHGRHRPSLIIVDDLEDQEAVLSSEQRDKLRDWFEKTLLKAGDPLTNVIFVGTVLHYDSLLACHVEEKPGPRKVTGWTTRKYQAVEAWTDHPQMWEKWELIFNGEELHDGKSGPDAARKFYMSNRDKMLEGTKVLWPELEDYEQLMITRVREGRLSFQSEKQNEPLDPKECIFREESFQYWDRDFASAADLIARIGNHGRFYGGCDPSLGKSGGRGDFTAIVTILEDKRDKRLYVIAADLAIRRPDSTIDKIIEYAKLYPYREFGVESNQFQELLISQLNERARHLGVNPRVKAITSTAHKQTRIESLEPLISQGILRFSRRHQLLIEQLRQFPLGAHDDGPDALQMAVEAARRPKGELKLIPI